MKIVGLSLLAIFCLLVIASFYILRTQILIPGADRQPFTPIAIRAEDPNQGKPQAAITIVYFSSFTCPACRTSALTMDQLRAVYGDRLRIVRKDLPLDTETARPAALAGRCAQQQGKFWQYHDELFNQQSKLAADPTIWLAIATTVGLDKTIFSQCFNDRSTMSLIEQDIADAAAVSIPSVPYFELNGQVRVAEDIPLSQWRQIIDTSLVL